MSISNEFRQAMQAEQATIDSAQFFDNWEPPGNSSGMRYDCLLTDVHGDVKVNKDDGTTSAWVRLTWQITEGELAGREFGVFYTTKNPSGFGPLLSLASQAADDNSIYASRSVVRAAEALEPFKGGLLARIVVRKRAGKTRDFTDYNYDTILDKAEVAV